MPYKTLKLFDELFPRSATHFVTREDRKKEKQLNVWEWQKYMEADVLTLFAASHRQHEDLFQRTRFILRLGTYREITNHMAGRKTETRKDDNTPEWKGFLDRKLSDTELDELDGWKPKPSDIWDSVDALITSGFRLTLSYNSKTKLASVTLIDNREKSATAGFALSAADGDGALALKAMIFKHFVILKEDWNSISDTAPRAKRG